MSVVPNQWPPQRSCKQIQVVMKRIIIISTAQNCFFNWVHNQGKPSTCIWEAFSLSKQIALKCIEHIHASTGINVFHFNYHLTSISTLPINSGLPASMTLYFFCRCFLFICEDFVFSSDCEPVCMWSTIRKSSTPVSLTSPRPQAHHLLFPPTTGSICP